MNTEVSYILSIDQGTSGTKAVIFDQDGQMAAKASVPLRTLYREGGFVEQEPEAIYQNVLQAVKDCLASFRLKSLEIKNIRTCGIANQRETFIIWDLDGKPLYNAVVWNCKRSIAICERLKSSGIEPIIKEKTGLIIDPYFSGTKLIWLYENEEKIKRAIDQGAACFGTVDTWILYRLTHGESYATDFTNASRTLFFDLSTLEWDKGLLEKLGLTTLILPAVKPSSSYFGMSDFDGAFDQALPITALIGDSHAAAFGQECYAPGIAKATLGTGCSVLMNTGNQPKWSANGMVTTICWSTQDRIEYALEGIIITCGATLEWLKNNLGILVDSKASESIAASLKSNNGVYLIPAFSGLGAPRWDMQRKAAIVGLTFDCDRSHVIRAALEAIPYQIKDVLVAMEADSGVKLQALNVDGGISENNFVTQFLADLLEKPVVHLGKAEISALGAAYLAGLFIGIFRDIEHLKTLQTKKSVNPNLENLPMKQNYQGWLEEVNRL